MQETKEKRQDLHKIVHYRIYVGEIESDTVICVRRQSEGGEVWKQVKGMRLRAGMQL